MEKSPDQILFAHLIKSLSDHSFYPCIEPPRSNQSDCIVDRYNVSSFSNSTRLLSQIGCAKEAQGTFISLKAPMKCYKSALELQNFNRLHLERAIEALLDLARHHGLPIFSRNSFWPPEEYEVELFSAFEKAGYGHYCDAGFTWSKNISRFMWSQNIWDVRDPHETPKVTFYLLNMIANRPKEFDDCFHKCLKERPGLSGAHMCIDKFSAYGRWIDDNDDKGLLRPQIYNPFRSILSYFVCHERDLNDLHKLAISDHSRFIAKVFG